MTLDELKKHKFYCGLSDQQKVYVVGRCLGKSKAASAKEAWNCNSDASAEASANRAERNGNIRWCINEFFGGNLPTQEDGIKLAWSIANAATEFKDKLKALEIVGKFSGWAAEEPKQLPVDEEEETFEFGTDQGTSSAKVS